MIIWLASYPRSGNTLLRTILYQSFNLHSYSVDRTKNHPQNPLAKNRASLNQFVGGKEYPDSNWGKFYKRATRSAEQYLVKSHLRPFDRQPVIYVIRDGRSSSISYLDYMQDRFPEVGRTLTQIICGEDYYGSWSDHVHAWTREHDGPLLILRFDELVACSLETLERIADFIDYEGEICPWKNPREEMNRLAPWFVREGATEWLPRLPWNEHYELLFYSLHGEIMQELKYYQEEELQRLQQHPECDAYMELGSCIRGLLAEKQVLQGTTYERQQAIMLLTGGRLERLLRLAIRLRRLLLRSKL